MNRWSWVLSRVVLPAGDWLFGSGMTKRLRFLEEAQWWDYERLIEHRNQVLAEVVHIAYKEVPFYRDLMDQAGVKPEDVRTQEDLVRLPIATKELLRSGYPATTTRQTGRRTFENHTSGSTGTNFCVLSDSETAGWHRASFLLALQWTGWQIGEPHIQTGMNSQRNLERRLKDTFLRCHYVSAFQLDDDHLDQTLNLLDTKKVRHLWGYPGAIYYLARRAATRGWNQPLHSVVTWGDNLYKHYRKMIGLAFKAPVFDSYGCAEGIQIAAQCGKDNNYHIHTLDTVVEYLDDQGFAVPEGKAGNLIVTRLLCGPMPLIRYRVGDVGVSAKSRRCSCGRGYEVMDSIQGRDTDVVLTPSGNRLIVHFFTGVLEHFPQVESFQVIQEKPGSAVLRIVPAKDFSNIVLQRILATMRERGAADLDIDVDLVQDLPLTAAGKRRFIVSKLTGTSLQQEMIG